MEIEMEISRGLVETNVAQGVPPPEMRFKAETVRGRMEQSGQAPPDILSKNI